VLKPHRKSTRSSNSGGNPTPSDRIVNAFRYFEQQAAPGAVTVSPYVAQAPFSSMHHDVRSLAHSRKANLILLPSKIKVSHRGCRGGQQSGHGHRGCKSRRAGEPPLQACEEVPWLPLWARASCCRGHTG